MIHNMLLILSIKCNILDTSESVAYFALKLLFTTLSFYPNRIQYWEVLIDKCHHENEIPRKGAKISTE